MREAILVLGGGVREGGVVPEWVRARLDLALSISNGRPIICLSAGTVHRAPPLDEAGFPYLESVAGARYLIAQGYDPARVLVETVSYDTIGNAYFSRLLHVDPNSWNRLAVITSEFHMPRAEAVFRWIYSLSGVYDLTFHASANTGLSAADLALRSDKEAGRLNRLTSLRTRIRTLDELRHWIHMEHDLYSAAGLVNAQRSSNPDLTRTY